MHRYHNIRSRLILLNLFIFIWSCCFLATCSKDEKKDTKPPKVQLTVSIGKGIEGHPQSGKTQHDTGMLINYGYRTLEGYINLLITLDGKEITNDSSFIMNKDHTLIAVAEQKMLWKFTTNLPPYFSTPVIGNDKTVYFTTGIYYTDKGMLYALSRDGTLKWSFAHNTALFSPVIGEDGNIYVQDFYNQVLSFSPSGNPGWTYSQFLTHDFENVGQRCPAIGSDGTIYIGGCGLHALDPVTGTRKWVFSEGATVRSSPSVGSDGTIYIVLRGSDLTAVKADGTQKWQNKFTDPSEMTFTSPTIDQNGTIYLGAEGKNQGIYYSIIYAFNPDGTIKWKYPVEGGRFVRALPTIDSNGNIIVTTRANELANPARIISISPGGTKEWDYTIENVHSTPDDIYSTPAIDNNRLVYFGAETGYLYVLNPNGTLNYKYQLPCAINWSSPTITSDGILYIGGIATFISNPGFFVAIKVSGTDYAVTPWPKFRHDNRNSGRFGVK